MPTLSEDRIFYVMRPYNFSETTVYFQRLRTVYFRRPYIFRVKTVYFHIRDRIFYLSSRDPIVYSIGPKEWWIGKNSEATVILVESVHAVQWSKVSCPSMTSFWDAQTTKHGWFVAISVVNRSISETKWALYKRLKSS